jgi:Na+/serine symporter
MTPVEQYYLILAYHPILTFTQIVSSRMRKENQKQLNTRMVVVNILYLIGAFLVISHYIK